MSPEGYRWRSERLARGTLVSNRVVAVPQRLSGNPRVLNRKAYCVGMLCQRPLGRLRVRGLPAYGAAPPGVNIGFDIGFGWARQRAMSSDIGLTAPILQETEYVESFHADADPG